MNIAHLSDIHFGTHIPKIVDGLIERLHELEPDLVVISGDFTMAARHREFAMARDFLAAVPYPVLATPGNHDMPVYNIIERFAAPFRRYNRAIGSITDDRYANDACAMLAVNSARPWDLSLDWSHGRLSDEQIESADRFFAAYADSAFKALVVHHPFFVPEDLPGFRTIRNGEAMLAVLAKHDVQAILTGHLHRQFTTTRHLPLETGCHEIALLQVATVASSRRRDQPNAFAVIKLDGAHFETLAEVWDGSRFVTRRPAQPDPAVGAETSTSAHKPMRDESLEYERATF